MKNNSANWLYLLEGELHPNVLIENADNYSNIYLKKLKNQTSRFRTYFIKLLSRSISEAKISVIQVINASDVIHEYLLRMNCARNQHSFPGQIRQLYGQILEEFESLIEFCGSFDAVVTNSLPLTKYSITDTRIELRRRLKIVIDKIMESEVNNQLRELINNGITQLIVKSKITRLDVEYIKLIIDRLDEVSRLTTFEVENILYQYEFNSPQFFNYCLKGCNSLFIDASSLYTQLEILIDFEDRINSLPPRTQLRWLAKEESIRKQLKSFFKEKKVFLRQRIKLRRAEIEDQKLSEQTDRRLINLPVNQFGLLIRLFIEKGIIPKEDVGRTFAYYAQHFRTPKTYFISAESLQKKSTNIEYSTANKVKGHLIGMINWLNEHHNVQRDKERTS